MLISLKEQVTNICRPLGLDFLEFLNMSGIHGMICFVKATERNVFLNVFQIKVEFKVKQHNYCI